MKKNFWTLAMCGLLLVGSIGVVSCGGDDGPEASADNGNSGASVDNGNSGGTAVMTPLQQKEYMQSVAENLINNLPASDSKAMVDLGKHIASTYLSGNYNWDNVGQWAQNGFDAACNLLSSSDPRVEDYSYDWVDYTYIYNESTYERILMLSNFLGKFTAANNGWKYEKANNLQFVFTDQNGAQCALTLNTSGNVKRVHLTEVVEEDWDYYWSVEANKYKYTYNIETSTTTLYLDIPEKIEISLTQGGNQVVKVTIETQLSSLDGEEFNLAKSNLTFSVKTELSNGMQLNLNQLAYTANSKAAISMEMLKNGKSLLSAAVSGDPRNLPSCNLSAFMTGGSTAGDFSSINAKNVYMKIDILGQLQLQGSMEDVRQFCEYLNKADKNYDNEKEFKSYVNQANGLLNNFGMYFNNTEVKQASVKLESFQESKWYGSYWTVEPVIEFYDGSSYSTFSAFFNEDSFKGTIDAFMKMADQYASLVK